MSQSTTANLGGFSIKSKKLDESIMKQSQMINSLFENSNCTKPISNSKSLEKHPQLPSESSSSIMSMSSTMGSTR